MSESLFNKITTEASNFIEKETLTQVFFREICVVFQKMFL